MGLTIIDKSFIDQCIATFSDDNLDILQEECAELIQACSKVKRLNGHWSYSDPVEGLKEEITHVLICIEQVAKLHNITSDDINNEVMKKAKKYNFKRGGNKND